jgi:hypothetical protein
MLATDEVPFVVFSVGTGVGMVDERVVPIMVVGYDTSSGGHVVALLVGKGAILAFVSVQQAI